MDEIQRISSASSLQIQILQKPQSKSESSLFDKQQRYKSKLQMFMMGIIISLSAMIFGYGLTEISTISINVLVAEYHIEFKPQLAQGLLIGIMPLGGVFGALLNKPMMKYVSRKKSTFLLTLCLIFSAGMIQITTVYTLFIGRFLEGVCVGLYVSVGAIYLRQIAAKELRSQIGPLFSLGKVFGIVFAYTLQQILTALKVEYSWRILLGFNIFISLLQSVLVFFFVPDSPVQMVERDNLMKVEAIVTLLYRKQYIQEIVQEYKTDYIAEIAKSLDADQIQGSNLNAISYTSNRKKAILMGIHIVILRQFIGGNVLVTFSSQIIEAFKENSSTQNNSYVSLFVNILQLLGNLVAAIYITHIYGRRPLLLFGTMALTICNFGIAITLFFEIQPAIIVFMSLFMLGYGGSFLPAAWSYPSECVCAAKSVYQNVLGWIATSIVTSVPPIIAGVMPRNNVYPLFFFFGFYGIFGFTYIYLKLIQSKGRTYEQIISLY